MRPPSFPVHITTPVEGHNIDDDDDDDDRNDNDRSNNGKVEYDHRKSSRYSIRKIGVLSIFDLSYCPLTNIHAHREYYRQKSKQEKSDVWKGWTDGNNKNTHDLS